MEKQELRQKLVAAMVSDADKLFDFKLALMDREIAEGWGGFHAEAIWFAENVPPPLINDVGREIAIAGIAYNLISNCPELHASQGICDPWERLDQSSNRPEYINFRDVSALDFYSGESSLSERALFVSRIRKQFSEAFDRDMDDEIGRMRKRKLIESQKWCRHTPPFHIHYDHEENARNVLGRSDEEAGENSAETHITFVIPSKTPDLILRLMAEMAPDFPFCARLSSSHRLVFGSHDKDKAWWAVVFEPSAGFFLPNPALMLLGPNSMNRWEDEDIFFRDILIPYHGELPYANRGMEIFLLYILSRYRRLIYFYQQYLDVTCGEEDGRSAVR